MSEPASHYFDDTLTGPYEREMRRVCIAGEDVELATAAGVYSRGRLDPGTAVLLKHEPLLPNAGNLLDLGCGWGPIALTMARLAPECSVWAVDINPRARELTAFNAAAMGLDNVTVVAPQAVPSDMRFAALWSNPPIRVGKAALHELLTTWLDRLTDDGEAWLVVQKNLGADSLQQWLDTRTPSQRCAKSASSKGFRLLHVTV